MAEHRADATVHRDDDTETTPQFRETMTEHRDSTPQYRETMAEHRDDATIQGDDDRAQRRLHSLRRL